MIVMAALCTGCAQVAQTLPPFRARPPYRESAGPSVEHGRRDLARQSWWTACSRMPNWTRSSISCSITARTLASALARYQQARAATDTLRAAQSPTVAANAGMERSGREGSPQRSPGSVC
jgi:outer membrane protein TolC